ncbi:MAG TPA: hydrogenobyrinic acid a,c-diamide synthase (glutamine-hydrolyzing) [Euryarchaeota archaeon]|mgnify:CR=1 FL=1|nr:hydrogenobyrinic acid a,c-diamide synthase (glutamine-hydrolyzing) [Euryarchaeota archaeon]
MDIPRILISGTSSRAGKTIISIGIMRALRNRGYKVQPFKIGPDFIDPSYHNFATGRIGRNIDGFMMSPEDMVEVLVRGSRGADISVIEGTMGLYDSHNALDPEGSTADAARILKAPVVLVANIERISRTAAAFVLGYKLFDKNLNLAGAILNRAGNPRHAYKAKTAIEQLAEMKVLGVVYRNNSLTIPERHLGLVPAYERERLEELFDSLADIMEKSIDIEKLIDIAQNTREIEEYRENPLFIQKKKLNLRVGVARDSAFNFYYQDNIDAFSSAGAEIVTFDTINDRRLPELDALYIGGGFPEVQASHLERNSSMKEEIYEFCSSGKPCYAECGGLMYLGESITTKEGDEYEMAGVLPLKTEMKKKFQALGYVRSRVEKSNPIADRGDILLGHEFHHSKVVPTGKLKFAYKVIRGKGVGDSKDGIILRNTLASYIHLHILSYPKMVENFLSTAESAKHEG